MKFFGGLLAVSLLCAQVSGAQWVSLQKSADNQAKKQMVTTGNQGTTVNFSVPGFSVFEREINGEKCISLDVPGSSLTMDKGQPELCKLTSFVALPNCSSANVVINSKDFVEKQLGKVVPSRGKIMRNQKPETVAYEFGETYKMDGWYPADDQLVTVSSPFTMRDLTGVRLSVIPFQYNAKENKLRIYRNLKVTVTPQGTTKSVKKMPVSSDFESLYSSMFINYKTPATKAINAPEIKKNLLIITADDFEAAVKPLADWKKKCGYTVSVVKVSQAGGTADKIKEYLQNLYNEGKLCFITIVGDAAQVPTLRGVNEDADSDACFVKLAGNDNVMDAFISRISAETKEQVEYIVAKTIAYEQNPMQGADGTWYKQTLAIASNQAGSDGIKDYTRMKELNAELKAKMNFTKFSECFEPDGGGGGAWWKEASFKAEETPAVEDTSNHSDDKQIVFDAVNDGVSIINYCGHGSETEWVTSGFNVEDCGKLTNGMKLPVIWSVACVNGAYVNETCFAEAWLRSGSKEKPAGCIGIAAATTNMAWIPPTVWQKHIVFEEMCKNLHNIAIVQNMYGVLKTMEEYGVDDYSEGNQLSEQVVYFGEGTVALRFEAPQAVTVDKAAGGLKLTGTNLENVKVTFYDEKMENIVTVAPEADGTVKAQLNGQKFYTVYGPGIVPVIDAELN